MLGLTSRNARFMRRVSGSRGSCSAGAIIRKILHSRLPERVAHRVPPLLVEYRRWASLPLSDGLPPHASHRRQDRAPYALNFLAIVLATLIGGWRSGLVALAVSQSLVWYIVVPPAWSFQIEGLGIGGLAIATLSQSIILLIIALYQREIDKGVAERERRMELLDHALNEIDHRTRNNYSTVLALIQLQAQRSQDAKVKSALQQVADRIQAIADATERLARDSGDTRQNPARRPSLRARPSRLSAELLATVFGSRLRGGRDHGGRRNGDVDLHHRQRARDERDQACVQWARSGDVRGHWQTLNDELS